MKPKPIQPPTPLSAPARAEWDRLAPEIQAAGRLTPSSATTLAALCVATVRWNEAEQQIATQGTIVKSPSGFPIQNPYLAVARQAMTQVRQLSADLGLTPGKRQTAKQLPAMVDDDLDALLADALPDNYVTPGLPWQGGGE